MFVAIVIVIVVVVVVDIVVGLSLEFGMRPIKWFFFLVEVLAQLCMKIELLLEKVMKEIWEKLK